MYNAFYELQREPFHVTPDPDFLFPSPAHKEALAAIIYGIEQRKGFVAITGEVGVGKTTILRSYLDFADRENLRLIYVYNSNLSFDELVTMLLQELGIEARPPSTFQAVTRLHEALIEVYRKNQTVVLIVDEAQNMPVDTLESLRMLSNLETVSEKLIQIVLIGQPEFDELLQQHRLRQLRQRIAIHARLGPLDVEDSIAYLEHRLAKVALGTKPVFTSSALRLIAEASEGIPRNLNILSDNALITGYGYQVRPVNAKIVKEVLADRGFIPAVAEQKPERRRVGVWAGAGLAAAGIVALVVAVLALQPDLLRRADPQVAQVQSPVPEHSERQPPTRGGSTALPARPAETAPPPAVAAPAAKPAGPAAEAPPPPAPPRVASNPPVERPQLLDRRPAATQPPAAQPTPLTAAPLPLPPPPRPTDIARAPSASREDQSSPEPAQQASPPPPSGAQSSPAPAPAATPSPAPTPGPRGARSGSVEATAPTAPAAQAPTPAPAPATLGARRSQGPIPLAPPVRSADPPAAARPAPSIAAAPPVPAPNPAAPSVMTPSASGSGVAPPPAADLADASSAVRPLTAPPSAQTVRAVRTGDTLWTMVEEVYGFVSPSILRRVQDANPQIRNINVLSPGQEIVFPRVQESPFERGAAVSESAAGAGRN